MQMGRNSNRNTGNGIDRRALVEALEGRTLLAAAPLAVSEVAYNGGTQLKVSGTAGNDAITVSLAPEGGLQIRSGTGWKATYAGMYNSLLVDGGAGNDTIALDPGVALDAVLYGGAGNDKLTGGAGHDRLYGGLGTNGLAGAGGDDVLVSVGGAANDVLTGGDGRDSFWVDAAATEKVTDATGDETSLGAVHRVDKFLGDVVQPATTTTTTTTATDESTTDNKKKNKKDKKKAKAAAAKAAKKNKKKNAPAPAETFTAKDLMGQNLVDPIATSASKGYQNFAGRPLFADAGPSADDIAQGQVGDCYFLAVLSSVAKINPDRIRETVVDLGDGTFAVQMKKNGSTVFVRVDADLPVSPWAEPAYAQFGAQGSLWVAVVEKAFAFVRSGAGTYKSLDAGWMDEGYRALGVNSKDVYSTDGAAALAALVKAELEAGRSVTYAAGTPRGGAPLVGYHAYTVDSVVTGADGAVTGIVLRNPWGIDGAGYDGNNDAYVTVTPKQALDSMLGVVSATV